MEPITFIDHVQAASTTYITRPIPAEHIGDTLELTPSVHSWIEEHCEPVYQILGSCEVYLLIKNTASLLEDAYNAGLQDATPVAPKPVLGDLRNTAVDKGSKYLKEISGNTGIAIKVDTYDQLVANTIFCPATAHAMKKIMDAGKRGAKAWEQDMDEAINSLVRAKQLRPAMLKAIQRLKDAG